MEKMVKKELDFKWYMIRCATNKEEDAIKNFTFELEQENLIRFVSDFYIPREKTTYMKNNKKTKRTRLMFPGYVMAKMSPNAEVIKVSKRTNYIAEISGNNGIPTPLSDVEVNRILDNVELSNTKLTFYVEQKIKVNDGPFSDFIGTITTIDNDKKKLKLIVSVFKRETPIELNFDQVDFID